MHSTLFIYNDHSSTYIYTLSLHDALPIYTANVEKSGARIVKTRAVFEDARTASPVPRRRSEEHTSELQSQSNIVCRLLLEKKNCIAAMFCMQGITILALDQCCAFFVEDKT